MCLIESSLALHAHALPAPLAAAAARYRTPICLNVQAGKG
jgi:hypothetical protein